MSRFDFDFDSASSATITSLVYFWFVATFSVLDHNTEHRRGRAAYKCMILRRSSSTSLPCGVRELRRR